MLTRIWTDSWLFLLAASLVAFAVAVAHEKNIHLLRDVVRLFKGQSWVGRILLGVFALGMWAYASVKPGDGSGREVVRSKEKGVGGEGVSSKEQVVSAEDSSSVVMADETEKENGNIHTYSLLLSP